MNVQLLASCLLYTEKMLHEFSESNQIVINNIHISNYPFSPLSKQQTAWLPLYWKKR